MALVTRMRRFDPVMFTAITFPIASPSSAVGFARIGSDRVGSGRIHIDQACCRFVVAVVSDRQKAGPDRRAGRNDDAARPSVAPYHNRRHVAADVSRRSH